MLPADVDQHDRDVVGSASVECLLEQVVRRAAGGDAELHRLEDASLVDHSGEPVGAEQPPVAGLRVHDEHVELGVGIHVAEHPHEDRAPRVVARLLGVIRPESTRRCTKVWSAVIWVSASSRYR